MNRNTNKKDVLDSLDIYTYIAELINIPLGDATRMNGHTHNDSIASARSKEFSLYRSLCRNEACVRQHLMELLVRTARAEKKNAPYLPLLRAEIRDDTVRLADLTMRRKRLEDRRDSLKGIAKLAVQYRYFEDLDRRIPKWGETAAVLGIALSGEELRKYVCSQFRDMK